MTTKSGWDHVDGHRSTCLVVSPYTKRRQTISTFYNQPGVVHTIEQILGLPPMNQFDALAQPMSDCFTAVPDFSPFTARLNNIPLDSLTSAAYQNDCSGLSPKARYWAKKAMKQDFSGPDRADDNALNRITW